MSQTKEIKVGRRTVTISKIDKMFFSDAGITKGDFVEYYHKIADTMLPHLEDRPLTMHRFPDGIDGKDFYHKDAPDYFPEWIKTKKIEISGGSSHQVICNDAATLVYLADQACITPHVWLSRRDKLKQPDRLVFDLDPPGDDFEQVRNAGKRLTALLEEVGLTVFVQITGSKGLHIIAPLRRDNNYDTVRDFARDVADYLAGKDPENLTTEQRKNRRQGRVYIDVMRNAYGQTMVAPYAVRARPGAPVATPITLDELRRGKLDPQKYTIKNIHRRLGSRKDPWADIQKRATGLGRAQKKLSELVSG